MFDQNIKMNDTLDVGKIYVDDKSSIEKEILIENNSNFNLEFIDSNYIQKSGTEKNSFNIWENKGGIATKTFCLV